MIRSLLLRIASGIKGRTYVLDRSLPASALAGVALRRLSAAARGLLRSAGTGSGWPGIVFFEARVRLRNKRGIHLARGVTLGYGCLVDGLSREGVRLGDNVNIGPYCIIEASGTLAQLGEGCVIGSDSGIGAFGFIGAAGGVSVGANVIMGQRVSFHSEDHCFDRRDVPIREQGVRRRGIVIGDDCWVGAGVTFLDGARVGRGCVIGAGSVVRGTIPEHSIAAGVPARVLRAR